MGLELGERGVFAPHDRERVGNMAALGQLEVNAIATSALSGLCEEQDGDDHLVAPMVSLYARRMDTENQEGHPPTRPRDEGLPANPPSWHSESAPPEPPPTDPPHPWEFARRPDDLPFNDRAGKGLATWLLLLLVFGVGGLVLKMEELSAMVAISGLFVLSQAADMDPRWKYLHYSVTWVVPVAGLMVTLLIGYQLFVQTEASHAMRMTVTPFLLAAAITCVLSALRPFANMVAAFLFRVAHPSHTLRLAARITIVILALAVPGWYALRTIFDQLFDPSTPLIDRASLEGQLIGYLLLALASVGFLIRRDAKETMNRLGIGGLSAAHLAIVALGVVALYGLNAGGDWIQQTFFKQLWDSDHQVNELIAGGLGPGKIALLGISAGVGEEITLRGALQPKLGLVMTSLVFASLHLQYSWFGMAVIFLLGMILGIIRQKTNTTVAMAVHAVYDVVALFSV